MIRVLSIVIAAVVASFYYFPFIFTFFPMANTKMVLALFGLILLIFNAASQRKAKIGKDLLSLSLFALCVSLASLISMVYNNTHDGSYLTYIISMWVWLSAAYFMLSIIKKVHGVVSVELVCFYLIGVGTLQCVLAICIDNIPLVKSFVDSFLYNWKFDGRLYGIGCAVDVGGGRLAVLLVMIAYLIPKMIRQKRSNVHIALLCICYFIIATLGNMIGRTTSIGLLVSIVYMIYAGISNNVLIRKFRIWFGGVLLVCVLLFTYLYRSNSYWEGQLRFAFEGFFSLVEQGKWNVQSNNMLAKGFIYPDNIKTWLIGDGYMADPYNDPYYVGEATYGFYKNTDAGYSRFLFYFGMLGLFFFSIFMIKACHVNVRKLPRYKLMFLMILALNFIIWIKVSTDIFLAVAPFLCISAEENEEYARQIEDNKETIPS